MKNSGLRIEYVNHRLPLPELEVFEDYGYEHACADHMEAGVSAKLFMGEGYLSLTNEKFAQFVTMSTRMIEQLASLLPEAENQPLQRHFRNKRPSRGCTRGYSMPITH